MPARIRFFVSASSKIFDGENLKSEILPNIVARFATS